MLSISNIKNIDRSIKIYYWEYKTEFIENSNMTWYWYIDAADITSGTGIILEKNKNNHNQFMASPHR